MKSGTRILSVSNDEAVLTTRQLVLQQLGYNVISALGFAEALEHCRSGAKFDFCVLGSSLEQSERKALIPAFRANSAGRVIVLKKNADEDVQDADFAIQPAQLLSTLATIAAHSAA